MNQAVFSVTPGVGCNWLLLKPFLLEHIRQIACSQTFKGTWLDMKRVATILDTRSRLPHLGQVAPCSHTGAPT